MAAEDLDDAEQVVVGDGVVGERCGGFGGLTLLYRPYAAMAVHNDDRALCHETLHAFSTYLNASYEQYPDLHISW